MEGGEGQTSLVPDQFVDVQIVLAGVVPGVIAPHAVEHQFAEVFRVGIPHADGAVQRGLYSGSIEIIEDIAVPLVVGPLGMIGIENRIGQAACVPHDRHRPISQADELGQTAWLEKARNDDHVGAGVNQMG